MIKAKPFVKWVGGKSQLITQLEALLPADFDRKDDLTYIEPFVGGGAMMFYMLQAHKNITRVVINDINPDLTTCYKIVRDQPNELIRSLAAIQEEFYAIQDEEAQKEYFLRMRERFNAKPEDPIENTTLFFFLNRTCFNGLYRVNKSGKFNVPFGRYKNPLICDAATILADSQLLQRVTILTGDFEQTFDHIGFNNFFYFDPPYRPLSDTSSFNDYSKESFNDSAQIRLKHFCDRLQDAKIPFMLSNSDCSGENGNDRFFDELYKAYDISRVWASRSINSNGAKRGKLSEILVRNYNGVVELNEYNHSRSIDMIMQAHSAKNFETFMSQLQQTNVTLDSISDFNKVVNNVCANKDSLIKLNCLLGKQDLRAAVEALWKQEGPRVFNVLGILVAVRDDNKMVIDGYGHSYSMCSLFQDVDGIMQFLEGTGLADLFSGGAITDLVSYVYGIEVGLDSNARKNRGGKLAESLVASIFSNAYISYQEQVSSSNLAGISAVLGKDKKVFDFAITTRVKTYLVEVNFYSSGGSKLNEVARSYTDIGPKVNSVAGYEFVWITDGIGWSSARNKLEEAFYAIPKVYNLTSIRDFITLIKQEM